jgi:hypothetical protein
MNPLIFRELAILILREEVIFTLNNHVQRYHLTSYTYTLDYYNPFLVP